MPPLPSTVGPGWPALLGRPDNERLDAQRHPGTGPDQGHSCEAPEWPGGASVPAEAPHLPARDMSALLDYHNHIRASVHPPAANMEYMVSPHTLPVPSLANAS